MIEEKRPSQNVFIFLSSDDSFSSLGPTFFRLFVQVAWPESSKIKSQLHAHKQMGGS